MSDRYDIYDGWAWLYNRTMGPEYSREQLALLERALLPDMDKGAEILDLCCGTGQLIQPLVNDGYKVTGLDGSEDMLKFAKENAPDAKFLLEDARHFKLSQRFDAVFSTSASLNHIENLDDLSLVFANVYDCLRDGGRFVFDLNHPGQLRKWWRGQATEGEINSNHAWMVTPYYQAEEQRGKFTVTIYRAPKEQARGLFAKLLKDPLYCLLSKPRFIGLRLKLISKLTSFEPQWQREDIDFHIMGHDIEQIEQLLCDVGFDPVRVETIDGKPLDDNHSAHFVCTRKGGA